MIHLSKTNQFWLLYNILLFWKEWPKAWDYQENYFKNHSSSNYLVVSISQEAIKLYCCLRNYFCFSQQLCLILQCFITFLQRQTFLGTVMLRTSDKWQTDRPGNLDDITMPWHNHRDSIVDFYCVRTLYMITPGEI